MKIFMSLTFFLTFIIINCFVEGFDNETSSEEIPYQQSESNQLIKLLKFYEPLNQKAQEMLYMTLNNFNSTCLKEKEFEKKIEAYNIVVQEVMMSVHPSHRNHTQQRDKYLSRILWQGINMFLSELGKCYPKYFSLEHSEKWNLVSTVSTEIANRIVYQDELTQENADCLSGKLLQMAECFNLPKEGVDSLFYILLSSFKPQFGTCEENLPAKLCFLRIVKSCGNATSVQVYKHMLSPPGSIVVCENLKSFN